METFKHYENVATFWECVKEHQSSTSPCAWVYPSAREKRELYIIKAESKMNGSEMLDEETVSPSLFRKLFQKFKSAGPK